MSDKPVSNILLHQASLVNRQFPSSIGVNFAAAIALCCLSYGLVDLKTISNWASSFIGLTMVTLYTWVTFNRKYEEKRIEHPKTWLSFFIAGNTAVNTSFVAAYTFALVSFSAPISIGVLMVLCAHVTLVSMVNNSVTPAIWFTSSTLALPNVAGIYLLGTSVGANYGSGFLLGACAIIVGAWLISALIAQSHGRMYRNNFKMKKELHGLTQQKVKNDKKRGDDSIQDDETKTYNKKFFELMIDHEIRRAKRTGSTLCVMILEIDNYEKYLEQNGSTKASQCVRSFAQILNKASSRGGEFVARFGDNKFALLVPNVDANQAMTFATKINAQVAATNIEFPLSDNDGQTHLMMSAGIAEFSSTSIINIKDLIEQAQYALKTANRLGANQIQIFAQNVVSSDQLSNKTADNSEEFGEEFVEDNETTNVTSIGQLKTV